MFYAEYKHKEEYGTEGFVRNEHVTVMLEFLLQQDKRLISMKRIITTHATLEIN